MTNPAVSHQGQEPKIVALETMLRDLRESGANRAEPCGVHERPQWTCGFCLHELLSFLQVRDAHADEVITARNQRLSEIAVQSDLLRAALVGLVGVDGRDELEAMELVLRFAPAPAEDKAAAINGIHALLATEPPL